MMREDKINQAWEEWKDANDHGKEKNGETKDDE
jgi:hypothetical protein